jgi:hypothetical protein
MTKETSKTIELAFPFETGGKTVSAVTIRRPKGKDIRAMDALRESGKSEMEQSFLMATALTGMTDEEVGELDAEDFQAVAEGIASFFEKAEGQESGGA